MTLNKFLEESKERFGEYGRITVSKVVSIGDEPPTINWEINLKLFTKFASESQEIYGFYWGGQDQQECLSKTQEFINDLLAE